MTHTLIYDKIIDNSIKENRRKLNKINENYVYYENHHIIPRCIGGKDDEDNLVLLTAKEHYICHKLLTFIYHDHKIYHAFHFMTNTRSLNFSSNDYKYAKELKSIAMFENNPSKNKDVAIKIGLGNKGKTVSKESRKRCLNLK